MTSFPRSLVTRFYLVIHLRRQSLPRPLVSLLPSFPRYKVLPCNAYQEALPPDLKEAEPPGMGFQVEPRNQLETSYPGIGFQVEPRKGGRASWYGFPGRT